MFNKKKCNKCNNQINNKYEFCPHCGNSLNMKYKKNKKENSGMLGRTDSIENNMPENEFERFTKSLLGGRGGGIMGKMLNGVMKMIEKEMEKEMKNLQQNETLREISPKTDFQLFVNGKKIDLIKENNPLKVKENKIEKKSYSKYFSQKNIKKYSSLPREEPSTNIRRLSDKIIYELNTPGVKSQEDISITSLENSIEIKAIANKKAYFKIIPLNFPIRNLKLLKEKILLELDTNN